MLMAEQYLDRADIGSGFEQVGRKAVAQGMGQRDRYVMLSSQLLVMLRTYWHEIRPSHWLFPGRDESRPLDIGGTQPHDFGNPQACRVGRHQRSAMLQARHCREKPQYLVGAQDHRQQLLLARVRDVLDRPGPSQSDTVEETQCRDRDIEGGPRGARFNDLDLVGARLRQIQPVRRLLEILSEFGDRVDVAAFCPGEKLQTFMSSIIRRRSAVIPAVSGLPQD